jgi:hypothetical protein
VGPAFRACVQHPKREQPRVGGREEAYNHAATSGSPRGYQEDRLCEFYGPMQNVGSLGLFPLTLLILSFFSLLSCIKHPTLHLSLSEVGAQKTLMCGEVDKVSSNCYR